MINSAGANGKVKVTIPGIVCDDECVRPKKYSKSGAMLPTTMAENTRRQRRSGTTAAG
jgi:hypothetical protein